MEETKEEIKKRFKELVKKFFPINSNYSGYKNKVNKLLEEVDKL